MKDIKDSLNDYMFDPLQKQRAIDCCKFHVSQEDKRAIIYEKH